MLDKEKIIAAEAILKPIIDGLSHLEDDKIFAGKVSYRFKHCIKIAEDYATIDPADEWINTGVRVPKAYWDTRDDKLLNGNRPQKVEDKGWFIFAKKKDIADFKKFIETEDKSNGL